MILLDAGIPWSVAWSLEEYKQIALLVILGERDGRKFDWESMKWIETPP
jgi:hypothetical protein